MKEAAKVLRFPLSGIARDLDYRKAYVPSEEQAFATPFAENVIGTCSFADRLRGGSRPGLKVFTTLSPATTAIWRWPNGEAVLWPNGGKMLYETGKATITSENGVVVLNLHDEPSTKADKGDIPSTVSLATTYRHRIVLAAETMWYASRTGVATDFDYGGDADDPTRAAAGNAALSGRRGETITALVPVNDKALFICTARSIRMLSGEPTTGSVQVISENVGIISKYAWTFDGRAVWFMGPNGLYSMVPGESPLLVTARLPEDFKGFKSALLVYDAERSGIHIFADEQDGTASDWFYDIDNKAVWQLEYPKTMRPTCGGLVLDGGVDKVVFKCADGIWRIWDEDATDDSGTAIASKVAIGPLRVSARDDMDGMVAEVSGALAEGSSAAKLSIYTAHTPENAVKQAKIGTNYDWRGSLESGWNRTARPRTRGAWAVFVIEAEGKWAYESLTAVMKQLGRLR